MKKLKVLLGIKNDTEDELLELILDEAEQFILDYCRIDEVPEKLRGIIPFMAADLYRYREYGKSTLPNDIKSISEGSRSVTYESVHRPTDAFSAYLKRLKPYRRARVPSEVTHYGESI